VRSLTTGETWEAWEKRPSEAKKGKVLKLQCRRERKKRETSRVEPDPEKNAPFENRTPQKEKSSEAWAISLGQKEKTLKKGRSGRVAYAGEKK